MTKVQCDKLSGTKIVIHHFSNQHCINIYADPCSQNFPAVNNFKGIKDEDCTYSSENLQNIFHILIGNHRRIFILYLNIYFLSLKFYMLQTYRVALFLHNHRLRIKHILRFLCIFVSIHLNFNVFLVHPIYLFPEK